MFTTGEKRGLITLMILLSVLVALVVGRRVLFAHESEPISSTGHDTASMALDTIRMTSTQPLDTSVTAKKLKSRSLRKKGKASAKRQPVSRDPLSEPVNE